MLDNTLQAKAHSPTSTMSQEIVLIATITVAPGKQKRMDELFANSFRYMQENEPGTLEFRVYQETKDEIPRAVLLERYV